MVSPLLISRGLRIEENNEKKRKRVKRNEIQCMILVKSLVFVFNQPEKCFQKGKELNVIGAFASITTLTKYY